MKRYVGPILAILLLTCVCISCEKLETPAAEEVAFSEAFPEIPAAYGSLEAVTTMPEYPGWFQLWFEDDAGTIRIVRVQLFENKMHSEIKTIMRSHPMEEEEVVEDEG